MKLTLYTLLAIVTGTITGMAQCTPDAAAVNLPQTSIYPDTLDLCSSTSLTIVIGSLEGSLETGGLAVYVNWATLDSITGLPPEITYEPGGTIYNGSSWIPVYSIAGDLGSLVYGLGCITFNLDPTFSSSAIDITIHGTADYTHLGLPINIPVSQNAVLVFGETCWSANCSELFISEYVEMNSNIADNSKALELYNPTPSLLDLSQYTIERYSNGSQTPTDSMALSGTLNPYDVVVITNGQTDSVWVASGGYWTCL